MTLPDQFGKVATSTIEALRTSPGLLSVILLQLITLGVLFVISQRNAENQQAREMFLMNKCFSNYDKTGAVP